MLFPDGITLENEALRVRVLPSRGAKLTSLWDKRRGREWLLPSQLEGEAYPAATYGADYSRFDTSGFDECFPNIAEGPSPDGAVRWPDHGELWSRPWAVTRDGDGLVCRVDGIGHPYTLTRRLSLEGDTLRLEYRLENHGARALPHLWSAHPLLKVSPGMRVLLPEGVDQVFVNGASPPAFGAFGDRRSWPTLGSALDFGRVLPRETGVAVKLFVPEVPEGRATLWDPASHDALQLRWDPAEVPHLGLWLCYGGWPTDGRAGHLTVALEPCTGMPDLLHEAAARGYARTLSAGESMPWTLSLRSRNTG